MRIVFMGTPDFAVTALDALADAGHEVAAVFTRPDTPKNRGMKLLPPSVKVRAFTLGLDVFQPKTLKRADVLQTLSGLAPQAIIVAAYGLMLPPAVLELPPLGCLNIHASLLPKYRGASPINTAIIEGERETGITIMKMNEGLDTGDMLLSARTEITPDETAGTLHDRLALMGGELIVRALALLEAGEAQFVPQPESGSYARMINSGDCAVSFENACRAADKIRGLDPVPGAFAEIGGQKVKLFGARALESGGEYTPGRIESCGKDGAVITCANGKMLVREIQPGGGKKMPFDAFLRGRKGIEPVLNEIE